MFIQTAEKRSFPINHVIFKYDKIDKNIYFLISGEV